MTQDLSVFSFICIVSSLESNQVLYTINFYPYLNVLGLINIS